jgi:hypothetical protein
MHTRFHTNEFQIYLSFPNHLYFCDDNIWDVDVAGNTLSIFNPEAESRWFSAEGRSGLLPSSVAVGHWIARVFLRPLAPNANRL